MTERGVTHLSTKKRSAKARKTTKSGKNGKTVVQPKANGHSGQDDEDPDPEPPTATAASAISPSDQAKMTREIFRREKELAEHIEAIEEKKKALSEAIEPFYRNVGRGFIDRDSGRTVYLGCYQGLYFLKKPAQPKVVQVG